MPIVYIQNSSQQIDEIRAILNSSDVDLDTLEEIADFIKINRETLDSKVDAVEGKQLSTEDYTTQDKTKLESLPTNQALRQELDNISTTIGSIGSVLDVINGEVV